MHTVGDLIQYLSGLDRDAAIIFSKDGEGSEYSPWAGDHSEGFYNAESTWSGSFHSYTDTEAVEYYHDNDSVNTVVLWPIN